MRVGDTSVASNTSSTTTVTMPSKAITLTATYKDGTNIKTNSLTATDYRMVSLHARHNRHSLLLRSHIRHYPDFYL
jgi:hypothetical protein